ncbi:hypothetical protein [Mycobacterium seoulense]|uniref:Secreted protein n=1 Tax=Mycobacterium seoulense TaxID=386911 RepID=A0A7I7NT32_9MYCO|nr:hypothetical protein [Mycobacterium seoulense]MCV7439835.1 hypothetical protein [Mycobacterium seoulense]BBX99762.1 hypothetical protein MSEO_02620 [Mycobacterium seoulense]
MKRRFAALLIVGLTALAALTGSTGFAAGTALASPDPGQVDDIPTIDEWQIQYPTTMTNPYEDSVGSSGDWGGVGMWCQNLHANCA